MLWPQVSQDSPRLVSRAPRAKVSTAQPPERWPPAGFHGQWRGVGAEGEARAAADLKELTSPLDPRPHLPGRFLLVPCEVTGESGRGGSLTRKSSCWQGCGETPDTGRRWCRLLPRFPEGSPSQSLPSLAFCQLLQPSRAGASQLVLAQLSTCTGEPTPHHLCVSLPVSEMG